MIHRLHYLLCIILVALFTGGCWDQIGLKERTIVVGVGIDKVEGEQPILVSVQVVNLRALKGGSTGNQSPSSSTDPAAKNTILVEANRGKSFYDAIHKFSASSSRRITFAHNRVVILGSALAKTDISGILDGMTRDYEFRMINWFFVAERSAQEVLTAQADHGAIPALEINHMMLDLNRSRFIPPVNRNDFVFRLSGEGKASFAPLIQIESSGPDPTPRIRVERAAVFKKNQLIAVLTPEESQGLLWFSEKQKGSLVVISPRSGQQLSAASIDVFHGRTKIRLHRIGKSFLMEMNCTADGLLREIDDYTNNPKNIAILRKKLELALKKQVEQTINKAQQIRADFLGYASLIHAEYPQIWHRMESHWDQEFPKVKTEVNFKVNIKHLGLIKSPQLKISE